MLWMTILNRKRWTDFQKKSVNYKWNFGYSPIYDIQSYINHLTRKICFYEIALTCSSLDYSACFLFFRKSGFKERFSLTQSQYQTENGLQIFCILFVVTSRAFVFLLLHHLEKFTKTQHSLSLFFPQHHWQITQMNVSDLDGIFLPLLPYHRHKC